MEPKFQSSFIPKGPATTVGVRPATKIKERGLMSLIAMVIFVLAVALSAGVFGYKMYLGYRINQMGADLEAARTALASEPIDEFIELNNRIISTGEIVASHTILSPFFDFLESNTVSSLRFTSMQFSSSEGNFQINLSGSAPSYASVALQSDLFNKSGHFKNPVFSGFSLDDRGNVTFNFTANVDRALLSYTRSIENSAPAPVETVETPTENITAESVAPETEQEIVSEPEPQS